MGLPLKASPLPVQLDSDGTARVSGTRVTLESVVLAFDAGATPEEITQQYPSLSLTEVYEALGYYLRHTDAVMAYLEERRALADSVRRVADARFDTSGIRARLMARKSQAAS